MPECTSQVAVLWSTDQGTALDRLNKGNQEDKSSRKKDEGEEDECPWTMRNSWRGMLKDGVVKCDVNENMWLNAEDWAD